MVTKRVGLIVALLAGAVWVGWTAVAAGSSSTRVRARIAAAQMSDAKAPRNVAARRLRTRPDAVAVGTAVPAARIGTRVFANSDVGFSIVGDHEATYPVRTTDGGQTWRIDGPQLHVDAADAPEAVQYVGLRNSHTYFAYGSQAVDVTTNAGRTWWEAFLGELVVAVVPGPRGALLAYAQAPAGSGNSNRAVTWQYISRDGGRRWHHTSTLGGQ